MKLVFKYLKHNVRRCLEFYLVFVHFKLYDSEQRDPCEIAQTHMLSWAFSDHICRKYQQAFYEIPGYINVPGSYGAPRKLISCSGSIANKIKQSIFLSLHGSVFEYRKSPTHRRHRRVNLHPLDVLSENKS